MKHIKLFEHYNVQFLETASGDIYKFIKYLDGEVEAMRSSMGHGDETGGFFNYEIINDQCIMVSHGFSDYEESDYNELVVTFGDQITVEKEGKGESVIGGYDGDYINTQTYTFNNVDELIKWFKEEEYGELYSH